MAKRKRSKLKRGGGPGPAIQSIDGAKRKKRQIRYSDAEWEAVKHVAAEHGLSASEYVRTRTLDRQLVEALAER